MLLFQFHGWVGFFSNILWNLSGVIICQVVSHITCIHSCAGHHNLTVSFFFFNCFFFILLFSFIFFVCMLLFFLLFSFLGTVNPIPFFKSDVKAERASIVSKPSGLNGSFHPAPFWIEKDYSFYSIFSICHRSKTFFFLQYHEIGNNITFSPLNIAFPIEIIVYVCTCKIGFIVLQESAWLGWCFVS